MRRYTVLLSILAMAMGATTAHASTSQFVTFDPAAGEFPEGIAVDKRGNVYTTMLPLNQIWKFDDSGARTAVYDVPGSGPAGIKVAADGTMYVAVSSFDLATGQTDPATRGVYAVRLDGGSHRLPGTGAMLFPNDLTLDPQGTVYATDTAGGAVWRIPRHGAAELWADDPLLDGDGSFGFGFPIGANGIAYRNGQVIVANPERGLLATVPIHPDGSAGAVELLVADAHLVGVDGIAFDVHGAVYAGIGIENLVVRVQGDAIEVLATAADGLNQPSTVAFGVGEQTLYVANFSLFAPAPTPGVLTLPVGVPGQPSH